jgi:carbon starvation protein CstA
MITFWGSIALLIIGYMVYGKIVEKILGCDPTRPTPANTMNDGVDFVPMHWCRVFLIQFLNIAGLGPIFGAVAGALWGPVAFLWIVFGCIFAGAVHDFMSGMLSMKHKGASISEVVGIYLGDSVKQIMRVFSVVLLVLVGVVFIMGPAALLAKITSVTASTWVWVIVVYYFLATILPIDKLIGRIYPIFGAALLFMAVGVVGGLMFQGYSFPELTLANLHPKGLPIWPLLFITIACGAISGFHATQSPMMARCLENEGQARRVFYGAMIVEGMVALIWAAAGMAFYGSTIALAKAGPATTVVYDISTTLLGTAGGALAMLGVIACPITSGDTAFRSARLTIADAFKFDQKPIKARLMLAVPLFAVGVALTKIPFAVVWRYFAWSNQTLAMMVLWAGAAYLKSQNKNHWIATIPATFMTAVSVTYILQAPEGLGLATSISYPAGALVAAGALAAFFTLGGKSAAKDHAA